MSDIGQIRDFLLRPGAVAPADGLEVRVRSVRPFRNEGGRTSLEVTYSLTGLPDGRAEVEPEEPEHVAVEVQAWATEHARRFQPPPVPTDAELSVALPSAEELWQQLVDAFDARKVADGLELRNDGEPVTLVITREEWQRYVFACERGARLDHGVDADGPGDGPWLAIEDLSEVAATTRPGERFIVLTERGLSASTRSELPAVRSMEHRV